MSDRKTGYSSLNVENNWVVTNDVMFAYVQMKVNILLSVLSIFFFLFYDFNLHTQGFAYFKFVKYQLGLHRNVHIFSKCNVCISAIQFFFYIYRRGQAFFLYQNKSYIFPMPGLAKIEY